MTALADAAALAILDTDEAKWWRGLHELRDYGAEYAALAERLARLEAQLGDATLGTAQQRHTATERRDRWKKSLGGIESEAWLIRIGLVNLWHRLPVKTKGDIKMQLGSLAEGAAPRIALALWEHVKAGRDVPGMAPF